MSNRDLRDDARAYFVPIILGSNARAHKLSAKIFHRYGICPFVVDKKRSLWRFFDLYSYFVRLTPSNDSLIILEQLLALSQQEPYTQAILIPCSDTYSDLVDRELCALEQIFIVSKPENVLSDSPLANIPY